MWPKSKHNKRWRRWLKRKKWNTFRDYAASLGLRRKKNSVLDAIRQFERTVWLP